MYKATTKPPPAHHAQPGMRWSRRTKSPGRLWRTGLVIRRFCCGLRFVGMMIKPSPGQVS